MLHTILQILAFQALFLLVYDLLLRKETFFNYNRAYLLISMVLSLVLPFVSLPELQEVTTKDIVIQLPEIFIGEPTITPQEILIAEQAGITINESPIPLWQVIGLVGVSLSALLFLIKILRLYWLKYTNPRRWKGNILIVNLIKSNAAFSFFNTIFLGEQILTSERKTIYKHELVHVKQLHSVDLLFFEILRILFWFNPLVYIYQNRIKELHEFIADAKAVKQNGKVEYYQSLLNQIFDVNSISFTNTFFKKSLIKKRIYMLQKSKSKQMHLLKYMLLLPLVLGMLIYTSTEVSAQIKEDVSNEMTQELTEKQQLKKHYDTMVQMKKEGKTFKDIYEYSNAQDNLNKYINSKDNYLRFKAFTQFLADGMLERKSNDGTLTDQDIDIAEKMKLSPHKDYAAYRAWKKTQEAKDIWEGNADYRELRLVVNDLEAMTKEEQKRLDSLLTQVENNSEINKLIVCDTKGGSRMELSNPKNIKSSSDKVIEVIEQDVEVPFAVIEEAPTAVECKDLPTNEERKRCMSSLITKHVNKNFNKAIADSLDLRPGRQRIFVSFKIGKEGEIVQVRARAAHPDLEDEAIRVIKSLPKFIPGRQKGKPVVTPYSLPIVFQTSKTPKFDQFSDSLKSTSKTRLKELKEMRERLLKNSNDDNPVVKNLNKRIDSITKTLTAAEKEKLYLNLLEEREKIEISKAIERDKIPFSVVEVAPTHPDCTKIMENDERKKCTSAAVSSFVNKNFDTKMAMALGLPAGQQRILGTFTVDKQGYIKDIEARAPHKKLEEELVRVIKLLPQFVPGEAKGKKVEVPFSLPIIFQVAEKKNGKN